VSLLKLVMIVKDEAASIAATLASARPYIDRWTLLDTGSTDGTQALARAALAGLPGELLEEPFVDFGTTRSRALELAGDDCTFTLMLSGDETLREGAALRRFCAESAGDGEGAYLVDVRMGDDVYGSARLARARARWRYVGVTHEFLQGPGGEIARRRVPEALVFHNVGRRSRADALARWARDLALLDGVLAAAPGDARAAFYRAQTLECLGRRDEAIAAYRRRVALGGWREEVFIALLRVARNARDAGWPWPEVERLYLDAWTHSPHRAEPLFDLAEHWRRQEDHARAFAFGSAALAIPYPRDDLLFVEADVYAWRSADVVAIAAYYIGRFAEGEAAARRALARVPDDARLARNLGFYEARRPPEGGSA
jgi:tetratricopeptide (TPR) repeat protein